MGVTIEIDFYTCGDCGGTYGYPKRYDYSDCPFCLKRERNELEVMIDEKNERINKQDRSVSALKGTITRLKNRINRKDAQE